MTSENSAKLDGFRTKVEQRKAHEKKAFETCLQLIDAERVNEETLINAVGIGPSDDDWSRSMAVLS